MTAFAGLQAWSENVGIAMHLLHGMSGIKFAQQGSPVTCHHWIPDHSLGEGAEVACLPRMCQVLFRFVDLLGSTLQASAQEAICAARHPIAPNTEGRQPQRHRRRVCHCKHCSPSEQALHQLTKTLGHSCSRPCLQSVDLSGQL